VPGETITLEKTKAVMVVFYKNNLPNKTGALKHLFL